MSSGDPDPRASRETDRLTAVVIVNYRTPEDTIRAARSVHASQSRPPHIIIVDNGSGDASTARLADALPGVRLIVTAHNGGFASGCNVGIVEALKAGAERILLLNPDTEAAPGMIGALEQRLAADVGLGIVGPAVVSATNRDEVSSLGIRYSAATGRMRHLGYGDSWNGVGKVDARTVDGVSGCAMMIRREVIDRIGLLDENYFFGFEDLDYCLRACAAGFRIACVATTCVVHEGGASIGRRSPRQIYFATRNHLRLAARRSARDLRPRRWLRNICIVAFNLGYVFVSSPVPRLQGLAAVVAGVRDHVAGRYGSGPARGAALGGSSTSGFGGSNIEGR